jgi:butyryl-CoA dehydrogenase/acyl-CoA dehydrogenase
VAKSWPSQWCLAANDLAIQVHGGYGYTRDFPVEQLYRDNRLNSIHEGTFGIQALDLLARKIRLHDGASFASLKRLVAATIERASASDHLIPWARILEDEWGALERTTNHLVNVEDPGVRLANAGPYLEAFGHVVVAWLWLEQALVAARALRQQPTQGHVSFYQGKLAACRYFFRWELPKVQTWLGLLDPVDRTCLEMQPDWF